MPNQIVLAWEIDTSNTIFGTVKATAALAAVKLYSDPTTDPVLGQTFGLTVASDVTAASGPTTTKRTLTLNMTAAGVPTAPPPFPCMPRTSTPPVLPYPLRKAVTLNGSFFVTTGSAVVKTALTQIPSLPVGTFVQFLSQQGVFYKVLSVAATQIVLTTVYMGIGGNTTAFKELPAPVTNAAVYSSSFLDTNGVPTTPPLPAESGARSVSITYKDSTGAGPFTVLVPLTGKRPAPVTLALGSIDIAEIEDMVVATTGGFGNNLGQITLVELSATLPTIQSNRTPFDFRTLTDEALLLVTRALVYLPPSYFALAQQGASTPQLEGQFFVTTGSTSVPTDTDQTAVLFPGNVIRFAAGFQDNMQLPVEVDYPVQTVSPKIVTLAKPYRGFDDVGTGANNRPNDVGTRGIIGAAVSKLPTSARLIVPSPAASPSNDQLAGPLAQFVALEVAGPPPFPPGDPSTVPVPTFLSGLFTRTLQLAIAGVPIAPQPITFL